VIDCATAVHKNERCTAVVHVQSIGYCQKTPCADNLVMQFIIRREASFDWLGNDNHQQVIWFYPFAINPSMVA
jgi:hypothetical protein